MRLASLKASAAEIQASLARASSRSGEYLVVAAGAAAMLLVVGLFDMLGLLP